MALDISLMYIKEHVPEDVWIKAKEYAHSSGKTLLQFYTELFQNAIDQEQKEFKVGSKERKSKFPEELWARGKARSIVEGISFPEWIQKTTEENIKGE